MNNKENRFLLVFLIVSCLEFILHRKRLKTYNQMYQKVRNGLENHKNDINNFLQESADGIYIQVDKQLQTAYKKMTKGLMEIIDEQ